MIIIYREEAAGTTGRGGHAAVAAALQDTAASRELQRLVPVSQ
jgi:hypothetical protein